MLKRLLLAFALILGAAPAHAAGELGTGICETTTTTGIGSVNLAGAYTTGGITYLSFASQITSGNEVEYTIQASDNKFEHGLGTFTDASPDTLSRTANWSSDGSGAELDLPAGTHIVCLQIGELTLGDRDYGDITASSGFRTWTIDADSVALTTDTTGNYAAGDAEAGNALSGDSATAFFSSGTIEDARIDGSAEVDEVLNSDLGDFTCTAGSCAIDANAVALTTDTTGDYVGTVADGTGIDGTATGEGSTYTPTLDLTEINSATLGSGTFTTLTFNAGVTDPVLTFGSGTIDFSAIATMTLDDELELRFFEEDAGGTNYKGFKAPAALTASTTCTFEDDANFIPDSCVGDGSDADTLGADGDKGDITVGGTGTTLEIDANTITTTELAADAVNEVDLKAVDAAGDEECLTFESTVGDFEWQSCGGGSQTPWTQNIDAATFYLTDTTPVLEARLGMNIEGGASLTVVDAGAAGPIWKLHHDSTSPADGDIAADIQVFAGADDEEVGRIALEVDDGATTTEDTQWRFFNDVAGASAQQMAIGQGVVIGAGTTFPGAGNIGVADNTGIYVGTEEVLVAQDVASAVNYIDVTNAATNAGSATSFTGNPTISAVGDDTHVGLNFAVKGGPSDPNGISMDMGNGLYPNLRLQGSNAGIGGPYIVTWHNSASPAASDEIGGWAMRGNDSAANLTTYGSMESVILDPTDGSEDARYTFGVRTAGTFAKELTLTGAGLYPETDAGLTLGIAGNEFSNTFSDTYEVGHASDTTIARSAAGEATLEGDAVKHAGKQTIWVPGGAMTPTTTNGCAPSVTELATNDVMIRTCNFDTTTQESANFTIALPKSWNEGTVSATFYWSHPATVTNFGVEWDIACTAVSNDDAMDATWGTAIEAGADTGGTTDDLYITSETGAVTCAGTPAAEDMVNFRLRRVPADAGDTLAVDARLHGIKLYFTDDASTDE